MTCKKCEELQGILNDLKKDTTHYLNYHTQIIKDYKSVGDLTGQLISNTYKAAFEHVMLTIHSLETGGET